MDKEKEKEVRAALDAITRQFGKGTAFILGEQKDALTIETISTGSRKLDKALVIGGLPRGRIIEIYGPEASGKSTIALHAIAEAQKRGGVCAFVDAEHALDQEYAQNIGVDVDNLVVSQPDTGEQALELADMFCRSGAMDIIVIDSVSALVPKAEIEGEMGDAHVGLQARLMSQAMRKLTHSCSRTGTIIIFINQLRMKIGVMFGSPETTSGGNALKFYASVRLDVRRAGNIEGSEKDEQGKKIPIGGKTRIKVVKNKCAPPFRTIETAIKFGKGIDIATEVGDELIDRGIVEKSGSWYSRDGERIGQGGLLYNSWVKENLEDLIKELDNVEEAEQQDSPESGEEVQDRGDLTEL